MFMKGLIILIIAVVFFPTAACSEQYGQGVNENIPTIEVRDVIVNPSFDNKLINLEGKILTQCMASGCWFFLKDDTGHILVDSAPSGFTIPESIGKKAKVTGVVSREAEVLKIIARGVKIY